MKTKLTDLLYSEIAGSGDGRTLDRVTNLLDRRSKGQKLTEKEESVLAVAKESLTGILGDSKGGYCPDEAKARESSESAPLPFSSFAEGLARLQNRIQKRGIRPQLRTAVEAGAYRPDQGAKSGAGRKANAAKIAAIVKMARDERAKLKKPARKKK